jgi:tetraacyldisaccharide 4'-kinase
VLKYRMSVSLSIWVCRITRIAWFSKLPVGIDQILNSPLQEGPPKGLRMVTPVSALSARFHDLVSGRAAGLGPSLLRLGLRAASVPYGGAVRLRNQLYDRGWLAAYRPPVPVISVGNLTVGGTGKTPCVEFLARFYQNLGRKVAILSRGYGSVRGPSDEALVLRQNVPDIVHLTGANRVCSASRAVEEFGAKVLLLDDGFQHRRLARDFDLVLVDATNPWGYGGVIPRGLLREPFGGLRRADAVLVTRSDQASELQIAAIAARVRREHPKVLMALSSHEPLAWIQHESADRALGEFRGRSVAAFCGVGNPAAFRQTLADLGCQVKAFRAYTDHHAYSRGDVVELMEWARTQDVDAVVTTQKDLVKLRSTTVGGRDLLALRIGLQLCSDFESGRLLERLRQVIGA